MSLPSERLAGLGLALPPVTPPLAAYVPAVRAGELAYSSGQLPLRDGALLARGTVGAEVSAADAAACARLATLNGLTAIAELVGGLDAIAAVVKVTVFVAATPEFSGHPEVANGASELLGEIFAESGAHARSAVGVASLPLGAPVEVELTVAIASRPTVQPLAV